jgi:hypothetical protein
LADFLNEADGGVAELLSNAHAKAESVIKTIGSILQIDIA